MMTSSPLSPGDNALEGIRSLLSLAEFFGNGAAINARIAEFKAAQADAQAAAETAMEKAEAALLAKYAEREAAVTAKEQQAAQVLADLERKAAAIRALAGEVAA